MPSTDAGTAMGTMRGYLETAQPGPWREALEAVDRKSADHLALYERLRGDYAAYHDTPERLRPTLDPRLAESVATIEASAAGLSDVRARLPAARDAAFVGEAARLGGIPRVEGEPDWIRLMRDLEALRLWRVEHLDTVDVHLPPLLARATRKGEPTPMAELAFKAWAKAAGIPLQAVRERCLDLARAGMLPGVEEMPDGTGFLHVFPIVRATALEALVAQEGGEALAAEVAYAAEVLPHERFPVPEEAMARLGLTASPGPR